MSKNHEGGGGDDGENRPKNEASKWDTLSKEAPAFNKQEAGKENTDVRDAEFYKQNPDRAIDLAQELFYLRGGDAAYKEGAKWDKTKRAYVGEDGLPRDTSHLTGEMKKNPDTIDAVMEEVQRLREESGVSAEDVAHFTQNPQELNGLALKLVELRGGDKASREGGVWDERSMSFKGPDGLPRDASHLTSWLKHNPNLVSVALKEIGELSAAASTSETSDEYTAIENPDEDGFEFISAENDVSAEERKKAVEAIRELRNEQSTAETENTNTAETADAEKPAAESAPKVSAELQSQLTTFESELAAALNFDGDENGLPAKLHKIIESSSPTVQNMCALDACHRNAEKLVRDLEHDTARLKELPRFTFPWSKKGKEKRQILRDTADTRRLLTMNDGRAQSLERALRDNPPSEEDNAAYGAISAAEKQLTGIRLRIENRSVQSTLETASGRWLERGKRERIDLDKRIAAYRAENPDFRLTPDEKVAESAATTTAETSTNDTAASATETATAAAALTNEAADFGDTETGWTETSIDGTAAGPVEGWTTATFDGTVTSAEETPVEESAAAESSDEDDFEFISAENNVSAAERQKAVEAIRNLRNEQTEEYSAIKNPDEDGLEYVDVSDIKARRAAEAAAAAETAAAESGDTVISASETTTGTEEYSAIKNPDEDGLEYVDVSDIKARRAAEAAAAAETAAAESGDTVISASETTTRTEEAVGYGESAPAAEASAETPAAEASAEAPAAEASSETAAEAATLPPEIQSSVNSVAERIQRQFTGEDVRNANSVEESIDRIIRGSSQAVQNVYALRTLNRLASSLEQAQATDQAKLATYPRRTLPFTAAGREKRALQAQIAERQRSINSNADEIRNIESQPAPTAEEQATIETIDALRTINSTDHLTLVQKRSIAREKAFRKYGRLDSDESRQGIIEALRQDEEAEAAIDRYEKAAKRLGIDWEPNKDKPLPNEREMTREYEQTRHMLDELQSLAHSPDDKAYWDARHRAEARMENILDRIAGHIGAYNRNFLQIPDMPNDDRRAISQEAERTRASIEGHLRVNYKSAQEELAAIQKEEHDPNDSNYQARLALAQLRMRNQEVQLKYHLENYPDFKLEPDTPAAETA